MIYEVKVANDAMRLSVHTVHVDSLDVRQAVDVAERYMAEQLAQLPERLVVVSVTETGIRKVVTAGAVIAGAK